MEAERVLVAQIRPDHSIAQLSTAPQQKRNICNVSQSHKSRVLSNPSLVRPTVFSTSSTQKADYSCDRDPIIPLEEDSRAHDPDQRCQRLQFPTITRRLVLNALSSWPNIIWRHSCTEIALWVEERQSSRFDTEAFLYHIPHSPEDSGSDEMDRLASIRIIRSKVTHQTHQTLMAQECPTPITCRVTLQYLKSKSTIPHTTVP